MNDHGHVVTEGIRRGCNRGSMGWLREPRPRSLQPGLMRKSPMSGRFPRRFPPFALIVMTVTPVVWRAGRSASDLATQTADGAFGIRSGRWRDSRGRDGRPAAARPRSPTKLGCTVDRGAAVCPSVHPFFRMALQPWNGTCASLDHKLLLATDSDMTPHVRYHCAAKFWPPAYVLTIRIKRANK